MQNIPNCTLLDGDEGLPLPALFTAVTWNSYGTSSFKSAVGTLKLVSATLSESVPQERQFLSPTARISTIYERIGDGDTEDLSGSQETVSVCSLIEEFGGETEAVGFSGAGGGPRE